MRGLKGIIAVVAAVAATAAAACGTSPESRRTLRLNTLTYSFEILPEMASPYAREFIGYRVRVLDRETRQPIINGEGRIFASNRDGAKTWDGLEPAPEVGWYTARLNFIVAGSWPMAIQFRRDSLAPLERADWQQDVLDERSTDTLP